MKARLCALLAILLALSSPAIAASPHADAEAAVRAAYADYRTALFMTNQKDAKASLSSIEAFRAKWSALTEAWTRVAPPQYAADPGLQKTLRRVGDIAGEATRIASAGELAKAHEVLEEIRDQLAALRARNGVTTFSDRMNAYHEQMERVLLDGYDGFSAPGLARLRDDAAVLGYLADRMVEGGTALEPDPARDAALGAVAGSVANLRAALRANDAGRTREAVAGLKGPYSKAFLRFG